MVLDMGIRPVHCQQQLIDLAASDHDHHGIQLDGFRPQAFSGENGRFNRLLNLGWQDKVLTYRLSTGECLECSRIKLSSTIWT